MKRICTIATSSMVALLFSVFSGQLLAAKSENHGVSFGFILKHGQKKDPMGKIDESPCGPVSYRTVTRMPQPDRYIDTEVVSEYAKGRKLRSWRTPIDFLVYAIEGNKILISDNSSSYWIGVDGGIKETKHTQDRRDAKIIESTCPGNSEDFCSNFIDRKSKKPRLIVYPAICT